MPTMSRQSPGRVFLNALVCVFITRIDAKLGHLPVVRPVSSGIAPTCRLVIREAKCPARFTAPVSPHNTLRALDRAMTNFFWGWQYRQVESGFQNLHQCAGEESHMGSASRGVVAPDRARGRLQQRVSGKLVGHAGSTSESNRGHWGAYWETIPTGGDTRSITTGAQHHCISTGSWAGGIGEVNRTQHGTVWAYKR